MNNKIILKNINNLNDINFKLQNKMYNNIIYNDIYVNNKFGLIINLECEIYNFYLNKKIFMKINYNDYINYIILINKMEKDLNKNVFLFKSIFFDKDNIYLLGNIIKTNTLDLNNFIYTSFYKQIKRKNRHIDINKKPNIIPNNFKAIVTLRMSFLNYINVLHNDIIQIIIKKNK